MPREFSRPISELPTHAAANSDDPLEPIAGRITDRFIDQALDRALRRICSFRQQYPPLFEAVNNTSPGLNSFVGPARQALWNEVCGPYDNGTPPPSTPPQGGQCPVPYKLFVNAIQAETGTQVGDLVGTITLTGPINNAYFDRKVTYPFGIPQYSYILYVSDSEPGVTQPKQTWLYLPNQYDLANRFYYFRRVDGLPDSCGNAPLPEFPTATPVWEQDIDIQFGDQQVTVNTSIGGNDVDNYPNITFDPTLILEGIGEVTVNYPDITLRIPDWPDTPDFPRNRLPASIPDLGDIINNVNTNVDNSVNEINTNTNTVGDTIVNIINETCGDDTNFDEIKALIRCVCGNENATFTLQVLASDSGGDYFDIPPGTKWITFEHVGDIQPGTRWQNGGGDSPNVWYWGWLAICYDDRQGGIRQELHYLEQAVPVGDFATGVIFSPTYGNRGRVVAHIKEVCP